MVAPKVNVGLATATDPGVSDARVDEFLLGGGLWAKKLSSLEGLRNVNNGAWLQQSRALNTSTLSIAQTWDTNTMHTSQITPKCGKLQRLKQPKNGKLGRGLGPIFALRSLYGLTATPFYTAIVAGHTAMEPTKGEPPDK